MGRPCARVSPEGERSEAGQHPGSIARGLLNGVWREPSWRVKTFLQEYNGTRGVINGAWDWAAGLLDSCPPEAPIHVQEPFQVLKGLLRGYIWVKPDGKDEGEEPCAVGKEDAIRPGLGLQDKAIGL